MAVKKHSKSTNTHSKTKSNKVLAAKVVQLKQKKIVKFFVVWLSAYAVLLSFFWHTILGNHTYLEIIPYQLIFPVIMHAFTALLITFIVFWARYKTFTGKLFSAIILALLMVGYDGNLQAASGIIRAFIPGLNNNDPMFIVSLVYLVVIVLIAILLGHILEKAIRIHFKQRYKDVNYGLVFFVTYLLLVPSISMLKILPTLIKQSRVVAQQYALPANDAITDAAGSEKPDIYYIVLDRYTNNEVLQQQFAYNNNTFTDYLRSENFTVNESAYGHYPYTAMSIASTLTADYTKQYVAPYTNDGVQSRALYHNLIWQSSVVKALKQAGYNYYTIGNWYGTSQKAPLADWEYKWEHLLTVFGNTRRLRGIEANEFVQSPYYRFAQLGNVSWWPFKIQENDHVSDVREQLTTLNTIAKDKPGGRFIFAHILVPHDPFVFNSDGSLSPYTGTDDYGKPIKQKYVDQITFINGQIQNFIATVKEKSNGQSVIILNADEGAYPQFMSSTFNSPTPNDVIKDGILDDGNMNDWNDDWLKMKFGIQQAVYMPKMQPEDAAHLSSVNVFRVVLNRYLSYNLPYLPKCQFGLIDGNKYEYDYTDITARFSDTPDAKCKEFETVSSVKE